MCPARRSSVLLRGCRQKAVASQSSAYLSQTQTKNQPEPPSRRHIGGGAGVGTAGRNGDGKAPSSASRSLSHTSGESRSAAASCATSAALRNRWTRSPGVIGMRCLAKVRGSGVSAREWRRPVATVRPPPVVAPRLPPAESPRSQVSPCRPAPSPQGRCSPSCMAQKNR